MSSLYWLHLDALINSGGIFKLGVLCHTTTVYWYAVVGIAESDENRV